jgi:hypothetical protein
MKLDRILAVFLRKILIFSRYNQRKNMLRFIQSKHYGNLAAGFGQLDPKKQSDVQKDKGKEEII